MKIRESDAFNLLQKYGLATPAFTLVAKSPSRLPPVPLSRSHRFVVKANIAVSSRQKFGLVKTNLSQTQAVKVTRDLLGSNLNGLLLDSIIIAEDFPHDQEYYLALKSIRDGIEVLFSDQGGVEVEKNWQSIKTFLIPTSALLRLKNDRFIWRSPRKFVRLFEGLKIPTDFFAKLVNLFINEDAQYLEINPFIRRAKEAVALAVVLRLDEAAFFRHPEWASFLPAPELLREPTKWERRIAEIDSQIAASLKFVEIDAEGEIGMLTASAGASLFYADEIIRLGGKLSNYTEYSGNPPAWALEELTKAVCSMPKLRFLIIGGGIANFTDIAQTFEGIIRGLAANQKKLLKNQVKIFVRRGGPKETVGLSAMRALIKKGFQIQVFDRTTPLTQIVSLALGR